MARLNRRQPNGPNGNVRRFLLENGIRGYEVSFTLRVGGVSSSMTAVFTPIEHENTTRILDDFFGISSTGIFFLRPALSSDDYIRIIARLCHIPLIDKQKIRKELSRMADCTFRDGMDTTECSICLMDYKRKEKLRQLTCQHTFHKRCVDRWFLKGSVSCPLCRTQVLKGIRTDSDSGPED